MSDSIDEVERIASIIFDFSYANDEGRPTEEEAHALARAILAGAPKPKTIYRTTFAYTVLSEEPIPENMGLGEILEEADTGAYIGENSVPSITSRVALTGKDAADATIAFGSEPGFFEMDDDGYPLYDDAATAV